MNKFVMILFSLMILASPLLHADERTYYFKDGTRWTELRLDTAKYNSWFSQTSDGTYLPNYEKTEFYVRVDTQWVNGVAREYEYVWQHVDGQPDSLMFAVEEPFPHLVRVGPARTTKKDDEEVPFTLGTVILYRFDLYKGRAPYSDCMSDAGFTQRVYDRILNEIRDVKKGCFGTGEVLSYADIDTIYACRRTRVLNTYVIDAKLIDGIGMNKWRSRYCVFGPSWPANVTPFMRDSYMSVLARFERDGKVLYDQWPTPDGGMASRVQGVPMGDGRDASAVYDLQGRKVDGTPSRGIYIIGGKKRVVE